MKTNLFEKIAQKNKRKQLIKTVGASVLIVFVLLILGYKGLNELTKKHGEEIKNRYLLLSEIAYPNISYSNWHFHATSQFTGIFESHRYKNIDGIEIPFEPYQGYYSLSTHLANNSDGEYLLEADGGQSSYTHGSHYKFPRFYNINVNYNEDSYNKLTQDIIFVPDLKGQAVEIAITFDKPYSYNEIKTMIPNHLMINWYWIGTTSNLDTVDFYPSDLYGMKSYEDSNQSSDEVDFDSNYDSFIKNLQSALDNKWIESSYGRENNQFELKEDILNFIKNNPDSKTAKFSGVILTGRSENFEVLKNKEWIYASNLGQTVEVRPYHQLTK
ncbi:anti sigma factor C-terminal domain-containing protein [Streptococcus marimammalium]|uniref:anti sigma factor C-terminal domain-containing protein n=1 Tax=Streptococcus marimammalium TaxID=269666 RepID=UPI00036267DE|nr:anti sigma factor C-terminal domain-containing protein [Streptococcus marimammalium]